jgi:hypothetical protein
LGKVGIMSEGVGNKGGQIEKVRHNRDGVANVRKG